jgi:uncharacterized protein YndB with AHSA1/START domain
MPTAPQAAAKTGLVIDRASHTIRLTREFDAPRAEIFEAWTRPERVTCWWDAAGEPLAACEIDLTPGGAFKFVTNGRPEMQFAGVYREIAPPDRLVFEALGATGRVLLHQAGGQTRMTVEIECRSAEQLDQFLKMGIDAGTARTLDHLVAYVRRGAARVAHEPGIGGAA